MSTESKKAIGFVAILDIIFIVFLSLSGSFSGLLSTIFYIFAFVVPIFMGYLTTRDENSDVEFLGIGAAKSTVPFIAPHHWHSNAYLDLNFPYHKRSRWWRKQR